MNANDVCMLSCNMTEALRICSLIKQRKKWINVFSLDEIVMILTKFELNVRR